MDADSIIVFTASSLGAYQLVREFSDVYNCLLYTSPSPRDS